MTCWCLKANWSHDQQEAALAEGWIPFPSHDLPPLPDLTSLSSINALTSLLRDQLPPDTPPEALRPQAEILSDFLLNMAQEDLVAVINHETNTAHIAEITGPYHYLPEAPPPLRHRRKVTWLDIDIPLKEWIELANLITSRKRPLFEIKEDRVRHDMASLSASPPSLVRRIGQWGMSILGVLLLIKFVLSIIRDFQTGS